MKAKEITKGIVVWHNFHKCHYTILEESNDFIGGFIANREDDKLNTYTVRLDDICLSSKEMFEKLGYKLTLLYNSKNENYAYLYIIDYGNKYHEIMFMLRDKVVKCSKIFYDDKKMWSLSVDVEMQKAITQQMKEFGWLE